MKGDRWLQLVKQSIRRNRRDFAFSSIGVVIGISTLLFFTALGTGIKETVLERVFVVRQLEVEKPSYEVGLLHSDSLFGNKRLDDKLVDRLSRIDNVAGVFPKMKLMFPTSARGGAAILGKDLSAELIADGIPPELVATELVDPIIAFKDWEDMACSVETPCAEGYDCADGVCRGRACDETTACPEAMYCHDDEAICTMPIPFVISPQLLEIYNGSIHTALSGAAGGLAKLPKLTGTSLIGLGAEVRFGASYLGKSAQGKTIFRRGVLVGFSDKAIQLGATMPIGYVKRLNAHFRGAEAAEEYHSILVDTVSNDAVPEVAQTITQTLGYALSDKYDNAQRAGLLILLITLVFNLISLIILTVAAVNIMHTFLMIILERRRELALMRALGATRGAIRAIVLGEATVLGVFGGVLGVALGVLSTRLVDIGFNQQVGDFPFKPDTLFVFEPWMFVLCISVAVIFCWVGALLPAIRASRIDPAAALAGR